MNQSVPWTPEQVAEENLDQLLGGAIAEIDDYEEEEAAGGEDVDEEEEGQKPQATKASSASSSKAAATKARQQKQAAAKKQGAVASKTRSQLKPSSSSASAATTVAVGSGGGDEGSAAAAAAAAAEPLTAGGFRGPLKAAFKHWKAKQGEGGARAVQYCGRYGAVRLEGGEVSDGSGEAEGGLPPPQGSVALLFGLLWLAD